MKTLAFLCIWLAAHGLGCAPRTNDPALAARQYPFELHRAEVIDAQVFRRGTEIEIVNSTPHSYAGFDVWINQRYVRHVQSLPAGESIRLSLWDFRDEYGDRFNAGGFFRTHPPTPVRLVQFQTASDEPLVGLIAIRAEEVRVEAERARR